MNHARRFSASLVEQIPFAIVGKALQVNEVKIAKFVLCK